MDYKYRHLLLNIPTRHIIQMIKDTGSDSEMRMQLENLANKNLNNFFILGSTETISKYMSLGQRMNLIGSKYAWYGLTLVNINTCRDQLFISFKNI